MHPHTNLPGQILVSAVMPKTKQSPLRINIGFVIHESPGYSKVFEFDFPELKIADDLNLTAFTCTVKFSRTQEGIYTEVDASGQAEAECVRCLDPIPLRLHNQFGELYTFTTPTSSDEADLKVPDDGYIDLKPLIREYLLLDQPINTLCKPDCAGLCPICGANLNIEDCGHPSLQNSA